MYKKRFLIAAVAGFMSTSCFTPAGAADSASTELQIKGTAQSVCRMPAPNATDQANAAVSNLTITVQNLINQQDATVQAWSTTLGFTDVMCNYAAVLSMHSQNGGMVPVTPITQVVGGQFLTRVDYTATANWGSLNSLVLDTASQNDTPVSVQAAGANRGDLTVRLETQASTVPLLKGEFQDTLVIKVGPSI